MTVQRTLGFLLVGLQAAVLGYLSKTQVFPLFVAAVALFGVFSKKRFRWSREQKFWLTVSLAALFYVKYTVAPHELRLDAIYIGTHLALVVGQFLMVLGVAQFFVYRDDDRLPLWLPGLGAVALVSVLNVRVGPQERFVAQVLTIAFTLVAALYFGSSRKSLPRAPRTGEAFPPDSFNLEEIEKAVIRRAMEEFGGNVSRVARELGVSRPALYRRLKDYDL